MECLPPPTDALRSASCCDTAARDDLSLVSLCSVPSLLHCLDSDGSWSSPSFSMVGVFLLLFLFSFLGDWGLLSLIKPEKDILLYILVLLYFLSHNVNVPPLWVLLFIVLSPLALLSQILLALRSQ